MSLWGKKTLKNESHKQIAKDIVNLFADKNISILDANNVLEYTAFVINDSVEKNTAEYASKQRNNPVKKYKENK